MSVDAFKRAAVKRKRPLVEHEVGTLRPPDVKPSDRVSNVDGPPSEVSEEPVDDMLARLGKRLEYVNTEVRFAEWYADVDKHLRAGSLIDVWANDSSENHVTLATISSLAKRQGVKREGDPLGKVVRNAKRNRAGPTAVKAEPIDTHAVVNKATTSQKATATGEVTATGTRTTARKAAAKLTTTTATITKPAVKTPANTRTDAAPTMKPSRATKAAANLLPTMETTTTMNAVASGENLRARAEPHPKRTRIFYPRRVKSSAEQI